MRKFKQVKRKEIVYGVDEWKIIEERAAALSIKTGTYIKRISLENKIVCYELKEACKKSSKMYRNSPQSVPKKFARKCTGQWVMDLR